MKRQTYIVMIVGFILFVILTSYKYSMEYKKIEVANEIEEIKQQKSNLNIKKSQYLSRNEAKSNSELKFHNNIFYLEDENE